MDGNLLKAAAEAHHKARRLVASDKSTVMDVYNSMAKIVDPTVTNNMFSKVNPLDAVAAAKGFYMFKDVAAASQR